MSSKSSGAVRFAMSMMCAICSALDITTDQLELLARESDGPEAHAAPDSEFFEMIRDFSEDEMALLKNYADYLRFLRNRK